MSFLEIPGLLSTAQACPFRGLYKCVTSRLQWTEQVRVRLAFSCVVTQDRLTATRDLAVRSLSHHGHFFNYSYPTIAAATRVMGMQPRRSCDQHIDWPRFDPRLEHTLPFST
jgi:hypothetical protein